MDRSYPVQVRARLDEPLSRWRWLVKWLLATLDGAALTGPSRGWPGRCPAGRKLMRTGSI